MLLLDVQRYIEITHEAFAPPPALQADSNQTCTAVVHRTAWEDEDFANLCVVCSGCTRGRCSQKEQRGITVEVGGKMHTDG